MAVPSAVEKMNEEADELLKKMAEDGTPDADGDSAVPDGEPAPQPPAEPAKEPASAEPVDDGYKQKYEVLQGKFNKEVPRMAEEIRQLKEQIASLTEQLTAKEKQPDKKVDDKEGIDDISGMSLSQKILLFKENYPDVYEALQELVQVSTKSYKDEISQLKEQLGTTSKVTATNAHERFMDQMTSRVSDWKTLNADPKFIEWLGTPERYTGILKLDLLRDAWAKHNVEACATFFEDYKKEAGIAVPAGEANANGNKKPPVTPEPKGRAGASELTPGQKVTPEKITEMSREIQKLMAVGKYEEANALEKKLDAIVLNKGVVPPVK